MNANNWGDANSVESSDEDEASSVNEVSEAPLLTASKVILSQHLSKIVAIFPKHHHVFDPSEEEMGKNVILKKLQNCVKHFDLFRIIPRFGFN